MSYPDFYKLKLLEKDGKRIHTIPEGRKVPFEAIGTIDPELQAENGNKKIS